MLLSEFKRSRNIRGQVWIKHISEKDHIQKCVTYISSYVSANLVSEDEHIAENLPKSYRHPRDGGNDRERVTSSLKQNIGAEIICPIMEMENIYRPIKQAAVKWKIFNWSYRPTQLLYFYFRKCLSAVRFPLKGPVRSERTNLVLVKIIVVQRSKHFNKVNFLFWNLWPDVNAIKLNFRIPEAHRNHRKKGWIPPPAVSKSDYTTTSFCIFTGLSIFRFDLPSATFLTLNTEEKYSKFKIKTNSKCLWLMVM